MNLFGMRTRFSDLNVVRQHCYVAPRAHKKSDRDLPPFSSSDTSDWCRIAILNALNKHNRCNKGVQTVLDRKTRVMELTKRPSETERTIHLKTSICFCIISQHSTFPRVSYVIPFEQSEKKKRSVHANTSSQSASAQRLQTTKITAVTDQNPMNRRHTDASNTN